jgi:hypothetical protein
LRAKKKPTPAIERYGKLVWQEGIEPTTYGLEGLEKWHLLPLINAHKIPYFVKKQ